jgi:cytochrome c oxidase subunit II
MNYWPHGNAGPSPYLFFALAPVLLSACKNLPAALDPHGSNAQQTAHIAWILIGGGALIFAFVMALAAYALFASQPRHAWLSGRAFVVSAGIVFPIITLTAVLVFTLNVWGSLARENDASPITIEVTAEMWWWRIRYIDANGSILADTANEVHIPVGRLVQLSLRSADVLHSFWVPQLAGKLDMIPGRTNVLRLRADSVGVFRGQCAEYCGAQHAKMAFYVVARTAPEFDAWLTAQRLPAKMPRTPTLVQGMGLFHTHCGLCHSVRGTTSVGQFGPDLTHLSSRRSIAAGTLPNNAGALAAWIAASQHIKPENRMPSFGRFLGEELNALASYLESLE